MTQPSFIILPAEFVGMAQVVNGVIDVGGVKIITGRNSTSEGVYVRRYSNDLSVAEIHIANHDGLAQEESETENEEAMRYPLGPKEYWRTKMVGHYFYGLDRHVMTNEEFEADWEE